MGNEDSHLTVN